MFGELRALWLTRQYNWYKRQYEKHVRNRREIADDTPEAFLADTAIGNYVRRMDACEDNPYWRGPVQNW